MYIHRHGIYWGLIIWAYTMGIWIDHQFNRYLYIYMHIFTCIHPLFDLVFYGFYMDCMGDTVCK